METATLTLTDFLLARIAEDEERARAAASVEGGDFMLAALPLTIFEGLRPAFPARVMAECEAKRAIVRLHQGEHHCTTHIAPEDNDPCETLESLALAYSDHPDYRADWS